MLNGPYMYHLAELYFFSLLTILYNFGKKTYYFGSFTMTTNASRDL